LRPAAYLRISKTTASSTVRYHWDSKERLVRESDASGNTLALYIYDDKDRLIAIEKGGQTYYTHTNYRGDILAITDTNKTRVATYKYGPWGELLSSTGTFSQPFRYAGYYFDEETGLYYLKARYYSPELGRFLTKDTFEGFNNNPQSLNLYAYANGNPVMNVDPDGNVAWNALFKKTERIGSYVGGGAAVVAFAAAVAAPLLPVAGTIATVAGGAALIATAVSGGGSIGRILTAKNSAEKKEALTNLTLSAASFAPGVASIRVNNLAKGAEKSAKPVLNYMTSRTISIISAGITYATSNNRSSGSSSKKSTNSSIRKR